VEVRRAILQKIVGPFSWLQTYKEFTLLDRNDQILIAIQRLYYLSNHLIEQNIRSYLFSRRCGGFFSIFSNYWSLFEGDYYDPENNFLVILRKMNCQSQGILTLGEENIYITK